MFFRLLMITIATVFYSLKAKMAERFKQKTVQQILQLHFKDDKTKLTAESLVLMNEVATIFIAEAVGRTIRQAKKDGDSELSLEQFEKILPQLLLDL